MLGRRTAGAMPQPRTDPETSQPNKGCARDGRLPGLWFDYARDALVNQRVGFFRYCARRKEATRWTARTATSF